MARHTHSNGNVTIKSGFGIGTIIACILSWTTWHSVFWVIVNGIFGWAYVIWWLIFYWKG